MALFNYATKEITLKVVYYGPGLSGKTTNLQHLHSILNPDTRGKLLSLATESDRTLFFDFLPVKLGKIRDFAIRFQLYTVPGQVRYNSTRKIVLKGADGIVFVADSQKEMSEQNFESFTNMKENLFSNNIDPEDLPVVLQYNKRDLRNISSVDELDRELNSRGYPTVEASAVTGSGVEESFNLITRLILKNIAKKHQVEIKPAEQTTEEEVPSEEQPGPEARPEPQPEPVSAAEPEIQEKPETPEPEPASLFDIPLREQKEPGPEKIPAAGKEALRAAFDETEPVPDLDAPLATREPLATKEERATANRLAPPLAPPPLRDEPIEEAIRSATLPLSVEERILPPSSPEPLRTAPERVVAPERIEIPVVPTEKLDLLTIELKRTQKMLFEIRNALAHLESELKIVKEFQREQQDTVSLLRDVLSAFDDAKGQKRKFKFW